MPIFHVSAQMNGNGSHFITNNDRQLVITSNQNRIYYERSLTPLSSHRAPLVCQLFFNFHYVSDYFNSFKRFFLLVESQNNRSTLSHPMENVCLRVYVCVFRDVFVLCICSKIKCNVDYSMFSRIDSSLRV